MDVPSRPPSSALSSDPLSLLSLLRERLRFFFFLLFFLTPSLLSSSPSSSPSEFDSESDKTARLDFFLRFFSRSSLTSFFFLFRLFSSSSSVSVSSVLTFASQSAAPNAGIYTNKQTSITKRRKISMRCHVSGKTDRNSPVQFAHQ